jgi:ABC-2 type transport system ATP-binding protein
VLILRAGRLVVDAHLSELQAGGGLLVTTGGDARAALATVAGVDTVVETGREEGRHRYRLGADPALAPAVAEAVLGAGVSLHALEAERRDLETLFAEVNAPREAEVAHD